MSTPTPTDSPARHRGAWRVVARREINQQVRSKGFQLSVAVLVLAVIGMIVAATLTSDRATTETVAVVGGSGGGTAVVERADEVAGTIDENTSIETLEVDDVAAAEQAVRDGDADAALLVTDQGFEIVGDTDVDPTLAQALSASASGLATERNADEQGVDLAALSAGTAVDQRLLDQDAETSGLRSAAALVFVLLFYLTALTFGLQLAGTVTQEKESRVVEILAAAVPIRTLLWGKVAGTTVLAVGQTALLAVVAVVGLVATGNEDLLTILGPAIVWFVVFFVLGFIALAGLWSVAGSLASRQQDLQSTTAPLQIILFAPYILSVTAGEQVQTVVSMLPIVSTMLMPSRIVSGEVPVWQLGVALATTIIAAVLLVRVSARIYERTLLRTGNKIGFREALDA